MGKHLDAGKLKNYFLGELSESEVEELDLLLISNSEVEENFLIAEEDLIEEYLDGELSVSETELFRSNYLVSSQRVKRMELVRDLKKISSQAEIVEPESSHQNRDDLAADSWFFGHRVWKPLLGGAFGLFVVGAIILLFWAGIGQNGLESEYAELNRNQVWKKENPDSFSKLILFSGASRSVENPNVLIKEKTKPRLLLDLALLRKPDGGETYDFDLMSGDKTVFSLKKLVAIENQYGGELKVMIPLEILEMGVYSVKITGSSEGRSAQHFSFQVN